MLRDAIKLLAVIFLLSPRSTSYDFNAFSRNAITRDVCIIGGGSSGTYAAIRTQEMGKSVVLIEKNGLLGGHTNTYYDPTTNSTIDYGVALFHNIDLVKRYFDTFDIPLTVTFPGGSKAVALDFRSGKSVEGYVDPASNTTAFQEALGIYASQLSKYPYLTEGLNLPHPIPRDLLLPFGDFVEKYSLEAIAYTISNNAQGFGDFLAQPTLYVLKYFSLQFLADIQTGFLTTANGNNGALYKAALQRLGNSNVLLNSHVIAMNRSQSHDGFIRLIVKSSSGNKLIRAKRLIVAIPPELSNLDGFDLTSAEKSVFGQFKSVGYYTAILRDTGLSDGVQYNNIAPNTPFNLPVLPGIYNIIPVKVPGLFSMTYGTTTRDNETVRNIKEEVLKDVQRVAQTNPGNGTLAPAFVAFDNHSPYELTVSTSAIEAGFYRDLYALQGQQNTWYTGAAFQSHDSGLLWNFTESLLPRVVAGL